MLETNKKYTPRLEGALKKGNVRTCYKLLSTIPNGIDFKVGNSLFKLTSSTAEEKELMRRSIKEKKELGLIQTNEETAIMEGSESSIDLDDIAGSLHRTVVPERPAAFSHTHWDTNKHPLPGFRDIGFGDIPLFEMFVGQYPLLECRVIFNDGDKVRSIVYKGKLSNK